ncbi:MAG: hypothetical protein GY827_04580 [Cytophagales bacterium]|nr:hypothetical protein [Cytophagales bacterium]
MDKIQTLKELLSYANDMQDKHTDENGNADFRFLHDKLRMKILNALGTSTTDDDIDWHNVALEVLEENKQLKIKLNGTGTCKCSPWQFTENMRQKVVMYCGRCNKPYNL